jgi:hypothetical protein
MKFGIYVTGLEIFSTEFMVDLTKILIKGLPRLTPKQSLGRTLLEQKTQKQGSRITEEEKKTSFIVVSVRSVPEDSGLRSYKEEVLLVNSRNTAG